jgi:hypothetical protein
VHASITTAIRPPIDIKNNFQTIELLSQGVEKNYDITSWLAICL